jgi:hypothetical protein
MVLFSWKSVAASVLFDEREIEGESFFGREEGEEKFDQRYECM